MEEQIKLNDIAEDLLILNKMTIDTLFRLENCSDCIALYVFYYKTAKWQKTNTIKANDLYIKKSLKWGIDKIKRTKATLKEHGLINIVQRRKDGKIEGWYVEISYLVTQKKTEDIKIKVEESNNTQKQQYLNPTSRDEEINALKENIKSLKIENEMLKRKKEKKAAPKTTGYDEIINEMVNDPDIKEGLYEFIKMRKLIKKPLTDRALKQLINKLFTLSTRKDEQIQILDNSIINNWSSIYPLKKEKQGYQRKEIVPEWLDKEPPKKEQMTPEEELAMLIELNEGINNPQMEKRIEALKEQISKKNNLANRVEKLKEKLQK